MDRRITQQYNYSFKVVEPGLVAIFISARCKSRKQLNSNKDEDLRIEINGLQFREIPPEKNIQLFNIPASWNGSKLKGLKKTIVFLIVLNKGEYIVSLIPKNSALIEDIKVEELANNQTLTFNLEEQAEDGDRRPWYTFVLVDLPLKTITAKVTTKYRWWDSDDVKLIIDGEIQKNKFSLFHRYWFWAGSLIKKLLKKETKEHVFKADLSQKIHYIEFWADKTPVLHKIELDLGKTVKYMPTVSNPKWTGDFRDDTEQMILARAIYGEAGNQSRKVKIAVGWSIKNRLGKDVHPWRNYKTYHDVILYEDQYEAFTDSNIRPRIEDPLNTTEPIEKQSWYESYEVADSVINGPTKDESEGAVFFHDSRTSQERFLRVNPNAKYIKQMGDLLFYGLKTL